MPTVVDADCCTACEACIDICPENVYELVNDVSVPVRKEECTDCGECIKVCCTEALNL